MPTGGSTCFLYSSTASLSVFDLQPVITAAVPTAPPPNSFRKLRLDISFFIVVFVMSLYRYSVIPKFRDSEKLNLLMHFVSFDVDGREGTGGTQILAGSAADATALVDGGDIGRLFVVGVARNHIDDP